MLWGGITSCNSPFCSGAEKPLTWRYFVDWSLRCLSMSIILHKHSSLHSQLQGGSRAVPSADPAAFVSLFSFFELLTLMLLALQIATKQTVLSTIDLPRWAFRYLRLRLKRCWKIPHSSSAQAFRTLGLTPCGPVALFQFRPPSCLFTWLLETRRLGGWKRRS